MIDKVVIRFKDGNTIKGYIDDFSERAHHISIKEVGMKDAQRIPVSSLKAIFFVKFFDGRSNYREKKKYGIGERTGDRVFVRFNDGESLVGFLSGDVPWDRTKGYFLSKTDSNQKGFYIVPTDTSSNNRKIFVILSAVEDVSVMS